MDNMALLTSLVESTARFMHLLSICLDSGYIPKDKFFQMAHNKLRFLEECYPFLDPSSGLKTETERILRTCSAILVEYGITTA